MKFRHHHLSQDKVEIYYFKDSKDEEEEKIDNAKKKQISHDDHGEVIIGNREDDPENLEKRDQNEKENP